MTILVETTEGPFGGDAKVATALGSDSVSAVTFALLPHSPNALVIGVSSRLLTNEARSASVILDEADTQALIDWCLANINQRTGTLQ